MAIVSAATSTTCCSSTWLYLGGSPDKPQPSSNPCEVSVCVSAFGPLGSSRPLPPWPLRGAVEQGCRAQPCAEAAAIQPSRQPKVEMAASKFTSYLLYGARGPCIRQWSWQSTGSPLPSRVLVAGAQWPRGPSSPWCSSTGCAGTGRELRDSRERGAHGTDDSRIIALPASEGETGQLGSKWTLTGGHPCSRRAPLFLKGSR